MTALIDALERALTTASQRPVAIRRNARVTSLSRGELGWDVRFDGAAGSEFSADAVVIALPAWVVAPLLSDVARVASARLAEIPFASSAVVTALLGTAGDPLIGSGFLVPPSETRTIKAATFSSNKWPWLGSRLSPGHAVVRTSAGRFGDESILDRDDAELTSLALEDLHRIVGRKPFEIRVVASEVMRWNKALPQYTVGHVERVDAIRKSIRSVPGLALAGAAFDGVGIPACLATAKSSAESIVEYLKTAPNSTGQTSSRGKNNS